MSSRRLPFFRDGCVGLFSTSEFDCLFCVFCLSFKMLPLLAKVKTSTVHGGIFVQLKIMLPIYILRKQSYESYSDLHTLLENRVAVMCSRVWPSRDRKVVECGREGIGYWSS